jgi:hypothetical protein
MYICSFFISLSDLCIYLLFQVNLRAFYYAFTSLYLSQSIAINRIYRDFAVGAGSSDGILACVDDRIYCPTILFADRHAILSARRRETIFRISPTRFQQDVCSQQHPYSCDQLNVSTTIMQLPLLRRHAAFQLID